MKLRFCIVAVVALMIPLLAAVVPMRGQSGDLRLSYDPWQPVLPAEAMVESGSQLGDWRLVVFGTTERLGDSAVPMLVMQLLKDTVLSGPQKKLTSEEARPFGYVQVVSVGERFLVFWKDRRGGDTSIWMRTVDTSGKLGSEEEYRGWPFPAQGAMVLEVGGRTRLLWNDTSAGGGILWQGVDSLGYPTAGLSFMDSGRASGIMGPFGNGVRAVLRVNELPILLDSVGEKIVEGSWSRKFSEKWHLSRDGVVTTVQGDTALVLYANVLDTVAERVIRFTLPQPSEGKIAPNSVFPYRDEDDSLFVMYARGGGEANMSNMVPFVAIKAHVHLDGQVNYSMELARWNYVIISPEYTASLSVITTRQVYWDGFSRIFFVVYDRNWSYWKGGYGDQGVSKDHELYVINDNEAVITDSNQINKYWRKCLDISNNKIIPRRIVGADRQLSNAQIDINNKRILLSTKTALFRKNIIEENAGLTISNGNVVAGWVSRGVDTTVELAKWQEGI
ncbi:MAG: hypothetical protein IT211_13160, partial [Armatimonadetes bacterium]|nr:hypothetical protein [Armatimonadota bacterium]